MENVKSLGELIREQMDQSSMQSMAPPIARRLLRAAEAPSAAGAAVVYPWSVAPPEFKGFSTNGGDEDYVIIHRGETGAYWSYKLAICDEETHLIGDDIYITITCHA